MAGKRDRLLLALAASRIRFASSRDRACQRPHARGVDEQSGARRCHNRCLRRIMRSTLFSMLISRFEAPDFCRRIWNFEIFPFDISLISACQRRASDGSISVCWISGRTHSSGHSLPARFFRLF